MKDTRLAEIRYGAGDLARVVSELRSEMDPGSSRDKKLKAMGSYLMWVISGAWELEDM